MPNRKLVEKQFSHAAGGMVHSGVELKVAHSGVVPVDAGHENGRWVVLPGAIRLKRLPRGGQRRPQAESEHECNSADQGALDGMSFSAR